MTVISRVLLVIGVISVPCLVSAQAPAAAALGPPSREVSFIGTKGRQLFDGIQLTSTQRTSLLVITKVWSTEAKLLIGNRRLIAAEATTPDQAQERLVQDLFVARVRPILTPEQREVFDRNVNVLRATVR